MTRYTKLEKKKYEKAAGFEGYNNIRDKVPNRENSKVAKQKNKRKFQEEKLDLSIDKEENSEANKFELEKKPKKKRKLDKKKKVKEAKKKTNNTDSEVKLQKSEKRRLRRIKERKSKTICFGCREKGHSVKDCPKAKEQGVGMCYNCGSTEHIAKDCKKPIKQGDEFVYAKCFICNEQGHLSGQCPKNEKGLYPNGGSCRFCNQVTHLAKNCTLKNKDIGTRVVGELNMQHGADDDDFYIQIQEKTEEKINTIKTGKNKTKKKIVKF